MKRTAIYAGSFDPITYGHLDLIKRGLRVFDRLIIGVAENQGKRPLFSLEERVSLIRQVTKSMKNVTVESFTGLLVDFAAQRNARVILRGLRAISDFEYEFQMALLNRKLSKKFEVVFMTPSEDYTYLNSHLVKEVIALGGDASHFVPRIVEQAVKTKLKGDFHG